ncbi:MAG: sigma-70 family RNA polymerase sigma factor [Acidimicrobiales bacterium]
MTRPTRRDRARDQFEQFVAANSAGLLRTAYLVVWDGAAAEDLVQECLLQVARRWPRVRSMEHPVAYARRVLVNLALDGAARRQRHGSELDGANPPADERHDEAAARALAAVETSADLIGILGSLPPRQRAVLVLRYFDDLSEAQTADVQGARQACSSVDEPSDYSVRKTSARGRERIPRAGTVAGSPSHSR